MRWVRAEQGQWKTCLAHGDDVPAPADLLAETLDSGRVRRQDGWLAAPCGLAGDRTEILAVQRGATESTTHGGIETSPEVMEALTAAWLAVRHAELAQRRLARLDALIQIAAQWNQMLDMETLLRQMAEASTRLLDAERASIFLWDRQSRTLVGRPALGVEEGELRIADDRGVVGQVIQTGQPRRVGAGDSHQEIDRTVDRQLKFRTRSLLCVPLFGKGDHLLGAFELINKRGGDFTADDQAALGELAAHAAVALQNTRQYEQLLRKRNQLADQAAATVELIGDCPAMRQLREMVERVAATDLAVLILGENGTGKEVVARLIHYLGRRRHEPLVAVNCAAMPEALLESELFGHERGAFTDARDTRIGKFELADGGTLLLDEIGDLSPGGQAKLLRVLEEKVIVRVGGSLPIRTDARVIAATNQSLVEMVRARRFREDLLFRLSVVTLQLPALRERGEDIGLLADHFIAQFAQKARRRPLDLTSGARQRLLTHSWPGNVRELRNLMERLVYLHPHDQVDAADLAFVISGRSEPEATPELPLEPLNEATRLFQIGYIKRHIERSRGNMTEAASRLGLHRANLYRKMKQLGMDVGPADS